MTVGPGDIEVNDSNAIIRGWLAAATGTFSGVFSASNVNAIDTINIKDGAVSAYYIIYPGGVSDVTINIPAQSENFLPRLFVAGDTFSRPLMIPPEDPTTFYSHDNCAEAEIVLYRNGVELHREMPLINCGYVGNNGASNYNDLVAVITDGKETFSYFDPSANTSVASSYRIRAISYSGTYVGSYKSFVFPGYVKIDIVGVELRKR